MKDRLPERDIDKILFSLVYADVGHGDYTYEERWEEVECARLELQKLIDRAFARPKLGAHIVDQKLEYQLEAKRKHLYFIFGIQEVNDYRTD